MTVVSSTMINNIGKKKTTNLSPPQTKSTAGRGPGSRHVSKPMRKSTTSHHSAPNGHRSGAGATPSVVTIKNEKLKSLHQHSKVVSGVKSKSSRKLGVSISDNKYSKGVEKGLSVVKHVAAVDKYMHSHRDVKNLLHIDEESLPTGTGKLFRLKYNLKSRYDLVNIAQYFQGRKNVTVKYIYLHRNFYKTVRSHPQFDDGFHNHALMLERYAQFIRSEYAAASKQQRDHLWRAVRYEWLHDMNITNFSEFLNRLTVFLGWKDCKNINVTKLYGMIKPPQNTPVNMKDLEFTNSLDTHVDIPFLLDIPQGGDAEVAALLKKLNTTEGSRSKSILGALVSSKSRHKSNNTTFSRIGVYAIGVVFSVVLTLMLASFLFQLVSGGT